MVALGVPWGAQGAHWAPFSGPKGPIIILMGALLPYLMAWYPISISPHSLRRGPKGECHGVSQMPVIGTLLLAA